MVSKIKELINDEFIEFSQLYNEVFFAKNPLLLKVYGHLFNAKGKQLRPILTLLAAKLCGGVTKTTQYAAIILELLHTVSLIHDDVVDEAQVRRGQGSVNAVFGNKVAVLSGDYLLSQVFELSTKIDNKQISQSFAHLGAMLAEGELIQLQNAKQPTFEEERYFDVIKKKTAVLFSSCMQCGAFSAKNPTEQQVKALMEYGEILGLCFQIKDDIFDYQADLRQIGKPVGNDIREKKITLPLICAYQKATEEERSQVFLRLTQESELSEESVAWFLKFVKEHDGIALAEEKNKKLLLQATERLSSFENEEIKSSLIELLYFVINREK